MSTAEVQFKDVYNEVFPFSPIIPRDDAFPKEILETGDTLFNAKLEGRQFTETSFQLEITLNQETRTPQIIFRCNDNSSVQAAVEKTRFFYLMQSSDALVLFAPNGKQYRLEPDLYDDQKMKRLLYEAKVYRKLLFIEKILNVKFELPEEITNDDIAKIDILFRGVTRANVFIESQRIMLTQKPVEEGYLERVLQFKGVPVFADLKDFKLFGQSVPTGPFRIFVMNAVVGNRQKVEELLTRQRIGETINCAEVEFYSLANQLIYHFDFFARNLRQNKQKLVEFIRELLLLDPEELAGLTAHPINEDVTSLEASEIAISEIVAYKGDEDKSNVKVLRADLSTKGDYWVVQLGITPPENPNTGDLAIIFVNRKTAVVDVPNTNKDAIALIPDTVLPNKEKLEKHNLNSLLSGERQ